MNFSFFKRKDKKREESIRADKNKKVEEVSLSERDVLINSIGKYKLQTVCDHMYINMDDISIYLLNLLKDNPDFLDYMSSNYLFGELVNKINKGPIDLRDIDIDNFELFLIVLSNNIYDKIV